jgi:hypothetical protein
MRHQLRMDGWPGRVLLIAMVVLTVAVWLCLVDDDEMCTHLCSGLAIFSVAIVLATLGAVQPLPGGPRCAAYVVSLHRLDPPPKSPFLS